jgi:hypothetical protein
LLPRERVLAALEFRPPDTVPLRICAHPSGIHEHGQKLVDLIRRCGHDFGDFAGLQVPEPPLSGDYDADGSYHAFRTDEWGTRWEFRIPHIWGHPVTWPLADWSALDSWTPPPAPPCEGPEFDSAKAWTAKQRERYYTISDGWNSLFEKLHSIRRFEDVLVDVALDAPEINRVTDQLMDYTAACVRRALALGADGVQFADDWGTQTGPMISPDCWRRFFKPRYRELMTPVLKAGRHVHFHSCGQVEWLLEEFSDLGVNVLWPQLPLYEPRAFAKRCRDLGLVVEIHPDRGDLMQRRTPKDIRDYVLRRMDDFDVLSGGSWLYVEIDRGFPWPNVEALFDVAMELRGQGGPVRRSRGEGGRPKV